MKTLVIHPFDISTQFLSAIYEGKLDNDDWLILTEEYSRRSIKEEIKKHDRIIMMGHGDDRGLFGHGHYVINKQNVYYLKQKQCVFIWCNADVFVSKYHLTGLYTGMIISEWEEAIMYCIRVANSEFITTSNNFFANTIGIHLDKPDRLDLIRETYTSENNPIIQFNNKNIYEK